MNRSDTPPAIALTLNGRTACAAGMKLLLEGASALDAVEAAVRIIEDNPADWSVGLGGFPNIAGQVELDASLMEGRNLTAGAVACLKRHKNPVSIARAVMEQTPHVMLVGEGADRFADSQGFPSCELLTPNCRDWYEALMRGEKIVLLPRVEEETPERARLYGDKLLETAKAGGVWREIFCAELQGTCNAIALDTRGDLAVAASTSGLALKLPGRVGDTPVIGAGIYADNRYGAAACVGNGELNLRLSSSRVAVSRLEAGDTAEAAARKAVEDLDSLPDVGSGGFHILVMTPSGEVVCASNLKPPEYYFMRAGDPAPRRLTGLWVRLKEPQDRPDM